MRARSSSARGGIRPRGLAWMWALTAVGLLLSAVRLRSRLAGLRTIGADGAGGGGGGGAGGDGRPSVAADTGRFVLLTAEGVTVDPEAVAAAVAHAEEHGLDVLELLPADLDAERALDLARLVDTWAYRRNRLAVGWGAGQAVLVDRDLLVRTGRPPAPDAVSTDAAGCGPRLSCEDGADEDPRHPYSVEADLAALVLEAKRCAPASCDLAAVRGVRAVPEEPSRRRALTQVVWGDAAPAAAVLPLAGLATLAAGLLAAPGWALTALVAYCAQPLVVLAGGPLPAGAAWPAAALRPLRSVVRAVRTLRAEDPAAPVVPDPAAERAEYAKLLADGTSRFFEPRRDTCPWCGGGDLRPLLTCGDAIQGKPGRFRLDRCRSCRHVFQNPRLSLEGLDFYYRDFYDGRGARGMELAFQSSAAPYRGRAELVARHLDGTQPEAWLDVGTGHGHFCLMARERFPGTRFEGLDLNEGVVAAARRGWVDEAHTGLLPDLAAGLAGRYDVVSMHHYLEHTREPADEVAAAHRVLRRGGLLLVEVPDPDCLTGRLLGRWWLPWFQPQHQHMAPLRNLCQLLDDEGFAITATERGPAHQPVAATMAVCLALSRLAPASGAPWQPPATAARTARHLAVFTLGAPLLALAYVADKAAAPVVRRLPGGSNAYRVLARRT